MNYTKTYVLVGIYNGGLMIFKNPTYCGDDYYSAEKLGTKEIVHIHKNDAFLYEGDVVEFLHEVRKNRDGGFILVKSLGYDIGSSLDVYGDRCTIQIMNTVYSIQFMFDRSIKITPDVEIKYIQYADAYKVVTPYSRTRIVRYTKKTPKGESYDRILNELSHGPMTAQEIAKITGIEQNRISGRLSELLYSNVVTKCGRKKMETGKSNILWRLV